MSANTLTNLIPVVYEAVDTISREMVGFIPAVMLDASAEQVALNQTITYPVVATRAAADITAAATGPDPAGETVGYGQMSISKARSVTFPWTGEEIKSLGSLHATILRDQFAQAMRTLVNEVEADLAALHLYASRGYGAAATAPFASTLGDPAQVRKILNDNGSPMTDLQMVINTTAGANLRTLAVMNAAADAGTIALRERGVLLDIHGFKIRESAQVKTVAAVGNNTGPYVINGTNAVGATSVVLKTGTGTILAGDIVYFNGDTTNKYEVLTGIAAAGSIVINKPGLRVALADGQAVAVVAASTRNMAFDRGAIHLLARLPAMPDGGDSAEESIVATDPISGISFQVNKYRQYHQVSYEVGLAWGVKAAKSENIAILIA
jgi:hypothetical protein